MGQNLWEYIIAQVLEMLRHRKCRNSPPQKKKKERKKERKKKKKKKKKKIM